MAAAREGADTEAVREQMRAAGQQYLDDFEAFLKKAEPLLRDAQMPREGIMQLARQWVDEFLSESWARSRGDQHLPDDLLAALPDSVRVFYAPR